MLQAFRLMQDAVDERQDADCQRHLSSLFQKAAFVLLYPQPCLVHLLVLLFQKVVELAIDLPLAILTTKEQQEEH